MASGRSGPLGWTIERSPSKSQVRLVGEIDLSVVEALRSALHGSLRMDDLIVLNLHDVSFMDSTGLHLLVELKREVGASGGDLLLTSVSAAVERLFEISGLGSFFRDEAPVQPVARAAGMTG
jgi:anti-anti-sigma factor